MTVRLDSAGGLTMRGGRGPMLAMVGVMSLVLIAGIYFVAKKGAIALPLLAMGGGLVAYSGLYISTTRITASSEAISLSRFGRKVWAYSFDAVQLRRGLCGQAPVVPGLLVIDRRSQEKRGEILASQFDSKDFEEFCGYLTRLGVLAH